MTHSDNLKKGEKGAWISIIAYLILSIGKLIVAHLGDSQALRADGLNNSTDVIASIAVLLGLKISRKPADNDHHYGHYRAETVASLFAAFIMVSVGIQVIYDTIRKLLLGEVAQPDMVTAWTALAAAIIMFGIHRYNATLAKKVESTSLHAAAQDNKSDAFVSLGAFVGITGAQLGLYWLDPVAGLIVGFIICKTAWDIFKDSTHALTDGFDEKFLLKIEKSIARVDEVKQVKDIKGRVHGNQSFIDIIILVDPKLNVKESHDITVHIENLLAQKHNVYYAHIHIEPYL